MTESRWSRWWVLGEVQVASEEIQGRECRSDCECRACAAQADGQAGATAGLGIGKVK